MRECVVLLHGFGATRRAWDGVLGELDPERYKPLALDLPGHGSAAAATPPITFSACASHVLALAPPRFCLCGYSLGGRVALHVALAAPERLTRLVLVSTTAGIEDPLERASRRRADERLAIELEQAPFERFIEQWASQPLFAGDPCAVTDLARRDQRRNRPQGMAAALRGIGSGEMEPLWERLGELQMPVTLLAGERDRRYLALARRMLERMPRAELAVLAGGHRLPLECPAAVARVLEGRDPEPGPGR